jgi:integrase
MARNIFHWYRVSRWVRQKDGRPARNTDYHFAWSWAWLFPGKAPCRDRRTGQTVRFRMHEAFVQRAIKQARNKLGLQVLPHELRHGYATHCMEAGVNPSAIQQVMGHKSLETTMRYLHAESLSVPSPLDRVFDGTPDLLGMLDNRIP